MPWAVVPEGYSRVRVSQTCRCGRRLLRADGDTILTSDPNGPAPLALAAGLHGDIVPV